MDSKQEKSERYEALLRRLEALMEGETDMVAAMANFAAEIQETFRFWWTGFYRVVGEQLVLGPFQGPVACTRIGFGKGVCGTAWKEKCTQVIPDVHLFPGHIACSSASESEIVVPVFDNSGVVRAVLDIDSESKATFDETDRKYLEQAVVLLMPVF